MTANADRRTRCRGAGRFGPILTLVLLLPAAALAKAPPAGRTYFTVLVGLEAPFSANADCIRFTKTRICYSDGTCGAWKRTDGTAAGTRFSFEIKFDQDGIRVVQNGYAEIEDHGARDTVGGVGMAKAGRKKFNFALTGRSTSRRNCKALLGAWDGSAAQRTPSPE